MTTKIRITFLVLAVCALVGGGAFYLISGSQGGHKNGEKAALAGKADDLILPTGTTVRRDLVYASPEGKDLKLDLYLPAGKGPFPVVVLIHGGDWVSGSRHDERALAIQLVRRGYVAVPVDYRLGSAGKYPQSLYDVKNAVRWIRAHSNQYSVDPDRIGAVGAGAGGQLAALMGATNGMPKFEGPVSDVESSSSVQAVVDIEGIVDFTTAPVLSAEVVNGGPVTRYLGGSFGKRKEVWSAASAAKHVRLNSAPVLFLDRSSDPEVSMGSGEMVRALKKRGVTAEQQVVANAPDNFWKRDPWTGRIAEAVDGFLQQTLMGGRANPHALPEFNPATRLSSD